MVLTGLVTCKDAEEARKISLALVEKRLAACANIIPATESVYRWKGKVEKAQEALLVFKTRESLKERAMKEIERIHGYELPAIEFFEAKTGQRVKEWVWKETEL